MTSLRLVGFLVASLAFADVVGGQVVRGRLTARDAGAGVPGAGVPGAVVLLLDSADAIRARALSTERGEFALTAPGAGRYRVRTLRIGFRPVVTPAFSLARDTTVAIEMGDIPVELPRVSTHETTQCKVRPDTGLATFALWEEAKTALLAAAITRDDRTYSFDAVHHSRLWDLTRGELREVSIEERSSEGTKSWASLPAERLRREGYVTQDSAHITFAAPDVDVLLSPYFADTHCFRVSNRRADGDVVGLDFDPAGTVSHVEIRGTLWIDRASRELRSLAFYYVNLGFRGSDTLAGGHTEFTRLQTGAWVLSDWAIRIPIPPQLADLGYSGVVLLRAARRMGTMVDSARWTSTTLRVTGGALRAVRRDSLPLWTRRTGTIDVTALNAGGGAHPARNMIAVLGGSERIAVGDSGGRAQFSGLVPGTYFVEATTEELEVLASPRAVTQVDVRAGAAAVTTLRIGSALDAARDVCGEDAKLITEATGVLVGIATRGDEPLIDAPVTVTFDRAAGSGQERRSARTMANDGRFIVCGVARGRPLTVRVGEGRGAAVVQASLRADQVVAPVTVAVAAATSPPRD